MAISVNVTIFPRVGRLYRNRGIVHHVSKIGEYSIEIIPEDTSIPHEISFREFYQLFGSQRGE